MRAIAAGKRGSLALTGDGCVLGFGNNEDGRLGLGDDVDEQRTPLSRRRGS